MQTTEENIKKIKHSILQWENEYQREMGSVQLMAVSKKKPAQLIEQAYQAGQLIFGESYVQEAILKQQQLSHLHDIEWHFIGPIQSNKTKDIAQNFSWVHSLDRLKIAQRLNDQRPEGLAALNICLQVNIDAESTKSGFAGQEVVQALKAIKRFPRLKVRGIMAIPKPTNNFEQQRRSFQKVNAIFQQCLEIDDMLDTLSIGMSNDIEAAIAEGSTMVRVGTAIFGARD